MLVCITIVYFFHTKSVGYLCAQAIFGNIGKKFWEVDPGIWDTINNTGLRYTSLLHDNICDINMQYQVGPPLILENYSQCLILSVSISFPSMYSL